MSLVGLSCWRIAVVSSAISLWPRLTWTYLGSTSCPKPCRTTSVSPGSCHAWRLSRGIILQYAGSTFRETTGRCVVRVYTYMYIHSGLHDLAAKIFLIRFLSIFLRLLYSLIIYGVVGFLSSLFTFATSISEKCSYIRDCSCIGA